MKKLLLTLGTVAAVAAPVAAVVACSSTDNTTPFTDAQAKNIIAASAWFDEATVQTGSEKLEDAKDIFNMIISEIGEEETKTSLTQETNDKGQNSVIKVESKVDLKEDFAISNLKENFPVDQFTKLISKLPKVTGSTDELNGTLDIDQLTFDQIVKFITDFSTTKSGKEAVANAFVAERIYTTHSLTADVINNISKKLGINVTFENSKAKKITASSGSNKDKLVIWESKEKIVVANEIKAAILAL